MKKSLLSLAIICLFLSFDSSFALTPLPSRDVLLKSARDGNAQAQSDLGNMYFEGRGVPQNYAEGVKWYRLAAEQGNANAQDNLGVCYATGRGVFQNFSEAVKWFTMAAEQGSANAQYNLGFAYERGDGVPQNYKTAYIWFALSAANSTDELHNDVTERRDHVAKKLSSAQLKEAQQAAREWKPKP